MRADVDSTVITPLPRYENVSTVSVAERPLRAAERPPHRRAWHERRFNAATVSGCR
jgi:hypothetical protein